MRAAKISLAESLTPARARVAVVLRAVDLAKVYRAVVGEKINAQDFPEVVARSTRKTSKALRPSR